VRHSCASEAGDNRIQPDGISLEQAESALPCDRRMMWIIVYTAVYIL
jgi:hypothetical protein